MLESLYGSLLEKAGRQAGRHSKAGRQAGRHSKAGRQAGNVKYGSALLTSRTVSSL